MTEHVDSLESTEVLNLYKEGVEGLDVQIRITKGTLAQNTQRKNDFASCVDNETLREILAKNDTILEYVNSLLDSCHLEVQQSVSTYESRIEDLKLARQKTSQAYQHLLSEIKEGGLLTDSIRTIARSYYEVSEATYKPVNELLASTQLYYILATAALTGCLKRFNADQKSTVDTSALVEKLVDLGVATVNPYLGYAVEYIRLLRSFDSSNDDTKTIEKMNDLLNRFDEEHQAYAAVGIALSTFELMFIKPVGKTEAERTNNLILAVNETIEKFDSKL